MKIRLKSHIKIYLIVWAIILMFFIAISVIYKNLFFYYPFVIVGLTMIVNIYEHIRLTKYLIDNYDSFGTLDYFSNNIIYTRKLSVIFSENHNDENLEFIKNNIAYLIILTMFGFFSSGLILGIILIVTK